MTPDGWIRLVAGPATLVLTVTLTVGSTTTTLDTRSQEINITVPIT